jgi:hypothetical protein
MNDLNRHGGSPCENPREEQLLSKLARVGVARIALLLTGDAGRYAAEQTFVIDGGEL